MIQQSILAGTFSGVTLVETNFLVVAGGGTTLNYGGVYNYPRGGAGAGGLRTSYGSTSGGGASAETPLALETGTEYSVTVAGGGGSSTFDTITSTGGGGPSSSGGSGGGGWLSGGGPTTSGGAGTTGQGFRGGNTGGAHASAAGGGGAGAVGGNGASYSYGGSGGAGLQATILSSSQASSAGIGEGNYFSGGGGGQSYYNDAGTHNAAGGIGGGGGVYPRLAANYPNSGGGGSIKNLGEDTGATSYGYGASGVVVLRYPNTFTATLSGLTESSNSPITDGSDKITIIKAGTGTITFN